MGWVRSLRWFFARPLVAAVAGVWVCLLFVVVLSCLVLSSSASVLVWLVWLFWGGPLCAWRVPRACGPAWGRLVSWFRFGFFWLGRFVLGVGLALAVSAWGGGGLALVWLFCRRRWVVVLFCSVGRCAAAAVVAAPCCRVFLVSSVLACLPLPLFLPCLPRPPPSRSPPFLLSLPRSSILELL